jgi:hypothetical protein
MAPFFLVLSLLIVVVTVIVSARAISIFVPALRTIPMAIVVLVGRGVSKNGTNPACPLKNNMEHEMLPKALLPKNAMRA